MTTTENINKERLADAIALDLNVKPGDVSDLTVLDGSVLTFKTYGRLNWWARLTKLGKLKKYSIRRDTH